MTLDEATGAAVGAGAAGGGTTTDAGAAATTGGAEASGSGTGAVASAEAAADAAATSGATGANGCRSGRRDLLLGRLGELLQVGDIARHRRFFGGRNSGRRRGGRRNGGLAQRQPITGWCGRLGLGHFRLHDASSTALALSRQFGCGGR